MGFNSTDPAFQDNSEHVLVGDGVAGVILDGLTITGGCAVVGTNNVSPYAISGMTEASTNYAGDSLVPLDSRVAGGGLLFINNPNFYETLGGQGADITVQNCIFIDNGAQAFGGAMAAREVNVSVNNSEFLQNYSDYEGGAFWGLNQVGQLQRLLFSIQLVLSIRRGGSSPNDSVVVHAWALYRRRGVHIGLRKQQNYGAGHDPKLYGKPGYVVGHFARQPIDRRIPDEPAFRHRPLRHE
ncbi:MAG TPA: hypothetical protein VH595_06535 [Verrucomicrobiae bacterium]|nr:hypothetical protein [Verrucomicrobiae bacterium]